MYFPQVNPTKRYNRTIKTTIKAYLENNYTRAVRCERQQSEFCIVPYFSK